MEKLTLDELKVLESIKNIYLLALLFFAKELKKKEIKSQFYVINSFNL